MAASRRVIEISIAATDLIELEAIARSRTEWACRVQRAQILLAYRADPSTYAVGEAIGVTHQTVQRCLDRAVRFGVMAALDDSPRPGRERGVAGLPEAQGSGISARALDNTAAGASRQRERRGGRTCLFDAPCSRHGLQDPRPREVQPHKVRYYLERRDEAFEQKMAEVLCVYREVAVLRASEAVQPNVAIISYDEKPGIQAIGSTAPDLPPQPGSHASLARDHEYKRYGTLSLLAGIDLLTGKVHACVEDRHRSREFVGLLKKLDTAYPTDTAIKVILDNHSAHTSKETKKWLATQPEGRFTFVFTPKHGSWLNLVEGLFSKMARSVLRHIRVASKDELRARILAYLDDLNREPIIHTWTYKIDTAA
jgi:transposase